MTVSTFKARLTNLRWVGWFFGLSASLSFSFAPPIARGVILDGMDPTTLLLLRFLIGGGLLIGTNYFTNPAGLRIDRQGLLYCFLIGSITGVAMLCFFWSLTRIEASMSSMILSASPLMVLTLLALRGERFTYRHGVRLALALVGVYLLIGPGGEVDSFGISMALIAVLMFAVQMVLAQWLLHQYDSRTTVLYTIVPMTIIVTGWWFFEGAEWHSPGLNGWVAIIILAVVSTFLARLMLYAAIRHIGSGQMALLTPLETLLTITWSILFLNETLSPLQWVGGSLILTSTLLAIQRLQRTRTM